ncbi:MAG: LUD domain-containing protein [Candidatus Hydrogenedentes bacterium]|nr:LUD domain-containing protein [Candidatus Hydrogenedentota bacterium]
MADAQKLREQRQKHATGVIRDEPLPTPPHLRYERLNAAILEAIEEPKQRTALYRCMDRGRRARRNRLNTLPGGAAFRDETKAIKDRCIAEQDELLAKFTRNAEARGAHVLLAQDGPAVTEYVLRVAREHGYSNVSKSKSLTTEEIEINHDLEAAGLRVVETDLGELIIQLVGEKPYHLVFPSVHKMKDDVAAIFAKATGKEVSADIPAIMPVVQGYLRPIFLNTDIGMTGANIGIAETGGIVIETNEGNARLVSSIGKCHICVMGIEKIVDTVENAMMMVLAHPVSASGQLPTTYVTWMHGRTPLGQDGPERETHIIILDNGRTRMREDPLMKEALNCIRCGACMNICPTYGVVGGHTFGHIYPGPIGIPWTAEVHGLEKAGDFADLCISCGLCKEICPAEIDMPLMIAEVKHRDMQERPLSITKRALMAAETASKLGCFTAPFSNWALRNRAFRWLMEKALGIDRRRQLPPFARRTFRQQFAKAHGAAKGPSRILRSDKSTRIEHGSSVPVRKVAFFHDLYANYNRPDLGMAAVRCLEAAGCEVVVPEQQSSGYPYIGYGDLDKARDTALYNIAQLKPWVEQGYDIVTTEPTAAYCLRVSYPKLLPLHPHAKTVGTRTSEIFHYLMEIEPAEVPQDLAGRRFGFHCSCHQRPLGAGTEAMAWLRKRGAEVELIETGTCCGMGGTFGLKHEPLGYALAQAVGEPLFKLFQNSGVEAIISESSVCAIHLSEGTGLPVYHPLELPGLVRS